MKKFLAIFTSILILSVLCACDIENDNFSQIAETLSETQTESHIDKIEIDTNIGDNIEIHNSAEYIYMSLDELLTYSTDIIKARFIDVTIGKNGIYHYEFEVLENIRGLGLEDTIIVDNIPADCYVIDTDITFSTYDIKYERGKSYLLLLCRSTSVYEDGYGFGFVTDSLIIPINENGKGYLTSTESLLYGSSLSNHLGSSEITSAFANGTFEKYAANAVKNNPFVIGDDYIKSTDMAEILNGSEYILEVVVECVGSESYSGDRATCWCEVVSVLKGDYTEENPRVTFPAGQFEVGETYIIAVNSGSSQKYLTMSSKNSIYSVDQRERITEILSQK